MRTLQLTDDQILEISKSPGNDPLIPAGHTVECIKYCFINPFSDHWDETSKGCDCWCNPENREK